MIVVAVSLFLFPILAEAGACTGTPTKSCSQLGENDCISAESSCVPQYYFLSGVKTFFSCSGSATCSWQITSGACTTIGCTWGLHASPQSVDTAVNYQRTVAVTEGTAPYSITSPPDATIATASIAAQSGTVTIDGLKLGTTSLVVGDSSTPQLTVRVAINVKSSVDVKFVTDVYHSTSTCDTGAGYTQSHVDNHHNEENSFADPRYTCTKKGLFTTQTKFLYDAKLKKNSVCDDGYVADTPTKHTETLDTYDVSSADTDNIFVCRRYVTRDTNGIYKDDLGNQLSVTKLIEDVKLKIGDSRPYFFCDIGYEQSGGAGGEVRHDGAIAIDPYRICIKYTSIPVKVCRLTDVKIDDKYCTGTGRMCVPGNNVEVFASYAGCDGKLNLTVAGSDDSGTCKINTDRKEDEEAIYGINVTFTQTDKKKNWTIPTDTAFPGGCLGKTVKFSKAYLSTETSGKVSDDFSPNSAYNQISFPLDVGPPVVSVSTLPERPTISNRGAGKLYFILESASEDIANMTVCIRTSARQGAKQGVCRQNFYELEPACDIVDLDNPDPNPCFRTNTAQIPDIDTNYEYYAVAFDTAGNKGESGRKNLSIRSITKLITKIEDISGDMKEPYYLEDDPLATITVSTSNNLGTKKLVCRWSQENESYIKMSTSQTCPTTSDAKKVQCFANNPNCEDIDGNRQKCHVYIACARSDGIYDQTENETINATWTTGFDIDKPEITINYPPEIVAVPISDSLPTLKLDITTNEDAICKYSVTPASYNDIPDAQKLGNVPPRQNRQHYKETGVPLNSGDNTVYISCRDEATPPNTNEMPYTFYVLRPTALEINATPSSMMANGRINSTINITVKKAGGEDYDNFNHTIRVDIKYKPENTTARVYTKREDGNYICRTNMSASCYFNVSILNRDLNGNVTVQACYSTLCNETNITFTRYVTQRVMLDAKPKRVPVGQEIILSAAVIGVDGNVNKTQPFRINFEELHENMTLSSAFCHTGTRGYCDIKATSIGMAEDAEINASVDGNSDIKLDYVRVTFFGAKCGNNVCEYPVECRTEGKCASACPGDCENDYNMQTSATRATAFSGLTFTTSVGPDMDHFLRDDSYIICDAASPVAECIGTEQSQLCKKTLTFSDSSPYRCDRVCSRGESGFYYAYISGSHGIFSDVSAVTSNVAEYSCPKIDGIDKFDEYLEYFAKINDVVGKDIDILHSTLKGTDITDDARATYSLLLLNIYEVQQLASSHLNYLGDINKTPTQQLVSDANIKSKILTERIYRLYKLQELVNRLTIASVEYPSEVVNKQTAYINVSVSNSGNDDRYGIVECKFVSLVGDPNTKEYVRTSSCLKVPAPMRDPKNIKASTSIVKFQTNVLVDELNEWNIEYCAVNASRNNDCSSSIEHDREGPFEFTSVPKPSQLTVTVQPESPTPVDNPNGIRFTATSADANTVKIIIYAQPTGSAANKIFECASRFCIGSKTTKFNEDVPIEYYAKAFGSNNEVLDESARKTFTIKSERTLISRIIGINEDQSYPYYTATPDAFIDVSAKISGQAGQAPYEKNIDCRWNNEDKKYEEMPDDLTHACSTSLDSTKSTCYIPSTEASCILDGERKRCTAYISCADSGKIFKQTAGNNLDVVWTIGEDLDPPGVTITDPADGSDQTTTSIVLKATTDEQSVCRWTNEANFAGGYNDIPAANVMTSADSLVHTASVRSPTIKAGTNTLYVSCQDKSPARNNMTSAASTTFTTMRSKRIVLDVDKTKLTPGETATLTASVYDQDGNIVQPSTSIPIIPITFKKSDTKNKALLSADSCAIQSGQTSCSVTLTATASTTVVINATSERMTNDTKTITFVPAVTMSVFPKSPTLIDNKIGIIFSASAPDPNLGSITIFVNGAAIKTCTTTPCVEVKANLPVDRTIEYYAVAIAGGNSGESKRATFILSTIQNLTAKVVEIRGDNIDTEPVFYVKGSPVFVKVSGYLTDETSPLQDIRCRWDAADFDYNGARNACAALSRTQVLCSDIPAVVGQTCTALADGRSKCTVHISCSDQGEIYNQTAGNNLDAMWINGDDIDAPNIMSIYPADGTSAPSTDVSLMVMTDEPAICRWSLETGGYATMSAENAMLQSPDKRTHTVQLTAPTITSESNTLYVSCQDVLGNSMASAMKTTFDIVLPGTFSLSAQPEAWSSLPAEPVLYKIIVTNTDAEGYPQSTIQISASLITGWNIWLLKSQVTLNAGASETVYLNVTPPFNVVRGDYTIDVTGTSPTKTKTLSLKHSIGQAGYLFIRSIEMTQNVALGDNATIKLRVSNIGDIDYYGYSLCSVRSPSNLASQYKSGCEFFSLSSVRDLVTTFKPTAAGVWNVSKCDLYASFSPDCSTILQGSIDGGKIIVTAPADNNFPATAIKCNGSECQTSYPEGIAVTLTCSDVGTGCDKTFFCVDSQNSCTPTSIYTGSIGVSNKGANYVRYYSQDGYGNKENLKSAPIYIFKYACGDNVCEPYESCGQDCVSSFSGMTHTQTDRGVRFGAKLSPDLASAKIIACSSNSTYTECKSAAESNNCGLDKKCLCTWFSFEPGCEMRCGDETRNYYDIAYQPFGQTKIIMSANNDFVCPSLNINTLMNYLKSFELYHTQITGEMRNLTGRDAYRQVLEEVDLLAVNQISYLKTILLDLTVTNSAEAIRKSQEVESEISRLLSLPPNQRRIGVTDVLVDSTVRLYKNVGVKISNQGEFWRYGVASCRLQKPDGSLAEAKTNCTQLPPGTSINVPTNLNLSILGNWSVQSCDLRIDTSGSCSSSIPYSVYNTSKSFIVRSPLNLSINASLSYNNVTYQGSADVSAAVRNPEDMQRYAFVACSFANQDGNRTRANSTCTQIGSLANAVLRPSVVANAVGTWTVESCSVYESGSSACAPAQVHDTDTNIGTFSAIVPQTIFLTSADIATQTPKEGEPVNINVIVRNRGTNTSKAFVECSLTDPDDNTVSAKSTVREIASQQNLTFTPSIILDKDGTWTLASCAVYRIINPTVKEQDITLNKEFTVYNVECQQNVQCGGTVTSCGCSNNVCLQCAYGYTCANYQCVSLQEECPGTTSSCYSSGGTCVACQDGDICQANSCVPVSGQPVPSFPMFAILVVMLVILIPVVIFVIHKKLVHGEKETPWYKERS